MACQEWFLFPVTSFLNIILRLGIPKLIIFPCLIRHQFVMGALLDYCAFVENSDLIAEFTGEQAVADIDGCLAAGELLCVLVDHPPQIGQLSDLGDEWSLINRPK